MAALQQQYTNLGDQLEGEQDRIREVRNQIPLKLCLIIALIHSQSSYKNILEDWIQPSLLTYSIIFAYLFHSFFISA